MAEYPNVTCYHYNLFYHYDKSSTTAKYGDDLYTTLKIPINWRYRA